MIMIVIMIIKNNNEYLYRIALQSKSTVIKGVLSKIT